MKMVLRNDRRVLFFVAFSGSLGLAHLAFDDAQGLAHRSAAAAQAKPAKDKSSPVTDPKAQGDDGVPRAMRTLKITVLGPDKKPIAKARIHAAIWAKEPAKTNRDYVCDNRGETVVELPREIEILRLWATFDGHVGLFAHWSPKFQTDGADIPEEYTFQLDRGTVIGGTVVNEVGQPIKGAKVQVMLARTLGNDPASRLSQNNALGFGDAAPVTDEMGRWTLSNVWLAAINLQH